MLHRELNVARKADGQVYVPITIGQYIITFTCFLHCAKKGRVVGNIKSEFGRKSKVVEGEKNRRGENI